MDPALDNALIKKEILHPGTAFSPLEPGTRVRFHYQTRKCDSERTLIDDSKKTDKPMELVLGKQFKLEVWEVIVQKMALNEVARFTVDKSLVVQYPFVSKAIRDTFKPPEERRSHTCGMTLQNEGLGYCDLDKLLQTPCDLEFTIELISIERPTEYKKEAWQMDDNEKSAMVTTMREQGNQLFKDKNYTSAEHCYQYGLGLLEQLMLKEKPGDVEWNELAAIKAPLLSNLAQCKLISRQYYDVITYCSEAIKIDPSNCKSYYRRAKAYCGTWNLAEAERDFEKCLELDPKLGPTVTKELAEFRKTLHEKEKLDKDKFRNLF